MGFFDRIRNWFRRDVANEANMDASHTSPDDAKRETGENSGQEYDIDRAGLLSNGNVSAWVIPNLDVTPLEMIVPSDVAYATEERAQEAESDNQTTSNAAEVYSTNDASTKPMPLQPTNTYADAVLATTASKVTSIQPKTSPFIPETDGTIDLAGKQGLQRKEGAAAALTSARSSLAEDPDAQAADGIAESGDTDDSGNGPETSKPIELPTDIVNATLSPSAASFQSKVPSAKPGIGGSNETCEMDVFENKEEAMAALASMLSSPTVDILKAIYTIAVISPTDNEQVTVVSTGRESKKGSLEFTPGRMQSPQDLQDGVEGAIKESPLGYPAVGETTPKLPTRDQTMDVAEAYKRGPAEYYQKYYRSCQELAFTLETFSSELQANRVYDRLDPCSLLLSAVVSQTPCYIWTIDGLSSQQHDATIKGELAELLSMGYTALFNLELKTNVAPYSGNKTYSIQAVPTLSRPDKLGGIEVVPSKLFSSRKKASDIHDRIVNLCKEGTLLPCEALAAELVTLGATRAKIAEYTGWDDGETKRWIDAAYGKLGVSSKIALEKRLGITVSMASRRAQKAASQEKGLTQQAKADSGTNTNITDNISFTFHIAGTAHHRRGANLLEDGDVTSLSAKREPNNEYDEYAIAIRCYGYKAGYVPAEDAEEIAELMDDGYSVEFTEITTSYYYKKKRKKINLSFGEYFYEYEEDYDHPIPTATVSVVCKKRDVPAGKPNLKGFNAIGGRKQNYGPGVQINGIHYVAIGDFIVRSHGYSCSHKGHEMTPVEASVTVLVANSILVEQKFRAFYCEQCGMYFVTDTAFERIARGGKLCCRVIGMEEILNPKESIGRFSDFAPESLIHQYGYNVNKTDGLSKESRQAILTFIVENDIMGLYDIISFLEGLIRTRLGMRNMKDAIDKWRDDVTFLEHYQPPKRSLKVGTLYARKSMLR